MQIGQQVNKNEFLGRFEQNIIEFNRVLDDEQDLQKIAREEQIIDEFI